MMLRRAGATEGAGIVDQEAREANTPDIDHKRREFIGRVRLATALPVVSALSLTWTKEAKAY